MALLNSISKEVEVRDSRIFTICSNVMGQDERGGNFGPGAPRLFSNGVQEYFDKHGGTVDHLAQIGT
jgi:hypothetical protein